jgi:hypothetical protein
MNPSPMIPMKEAAARIKSFSLYNFPPFVKGSEGGFDGLHRGNPPKSPFFKGGLGQMKLFTDKFFSRMGFTCSLFFC